MSDLRQTRRKITIAFVALVLLDGIAAVVLFSPLTGSAADRRAELTQLSEELRVKTREVVPLRGIDEKVVTARKQIAGFYRDRFAAQPSNLAEVLSKTANEHHIAVNQAKYDPKGSESGLQLVEIDATFSGKYPDMVQFINSVERSKEFFIVKSINLGEAQGGEVRLQLKLEGYTKAT